MHKNVEQYTEMRVIVVSLFPLQPVITCIDIVLQNKCTLILSSSSHFSAFQNTNSLSASSDVFAFASGCCQWLLTKHRAWAKNNNKKQPPPASCLIMCLNSV